MMFWSQQKPLLGVFAMLASAGLITASMAQQDVAADHQRMVEEIDAMVASTASTSGVARLDPHVRAAMAEVPRHEFVPLEYRSAPTETGRSRSAMTRRSRNRLSSP